MVRSSKAGEVKETAKEGCNFPVDTKDDDESVDTSESYDESSS